jgi:hypothetical protein
MLKVAEYFIFFRIEYVLYKSEKKNVSLELKEVIWSELFSGRLS